MERVMMRRGFLAFLWLLAVPTAAWAQRLEDYDYENLAFRGVSVDVGRIWPNKVESTPSYSVRVDLGYLGPWLRLVPSLTYWSSELKGVELERLADQLNRLDAIRSRGVPIRADELGPIDWRGIAAALDAQLAWGPVERVLGYAGAGLGIHALNGSGPAIDGTFIEDLLDTVTAGLEGVVGVEVQPLDRLRLYVEGRYTLLEHIRYPGLRIGGGYVPWSR